MIARRRCVKRECKVEDSIGNCGVLARTMMRLTVPDARTEMSSPPDCNWDGSIRPRQQWVHADPPLRLDDNGALLSAGSRHGVAQRSPAMLAEQKFRPAKTATAVGRSGAACFPCSQNPKWNQHRTRAREHASKALSPEGSHSISTIGEGDHQIHQDEHEVVVPSCKEMGSALALLAN